MSDSIQFDNEGVSDVSNDPLVARIAGEDKTFSLIHYVKKWKLAKTDKQASIILSIFGIVCILFAVFIIVYFVFGIGTSPKPVFNVSPAVKAQLPAEMQHQINVSQLQK